MPRIDAHQHFWQVSRGDYGWLTPALTNLYRDFLPPDLAPLLAGAGIDGTILVQAAPTEAETDFMLSLAESHEFIRGVVGWVDFEAQDAPERISKRAAHPKLKGLRPMIQDIADPLWILRPDLDDAFVAMTDHDLVFDALVLPRHLQSLSERLARHPALRTIIDHGAKPAILAGDFDDWARDMSHLARTSSAFCKLSGLMTEAGPDWTIDMLRPYVEHLLNQFGPDRLIWGSDWPVCTLAGEYERWIEATEALLINPGADERAAVLGGNAARLYRL